MSTLTENSPRKTVLKVASRKRTRDLTNAVTLRPADVFTLYGVPPSTLRDWCLCGPEADRLPSRLIPGRRGRRGVRLIEKAKLDAWLNKWGSELPKASTAGGVS